MRTEDELNKLQDKHALIAFEDLDIEANEARVTNHASYDQEHADEALAKTKSSEKLKKHYTGHDIG